MSDPNEDDGSHGKIEVSRDGNQPRDENASRQHGGRRKRFAEQNENKTMSTPPLKPKAPTITSTPHDPNNWLTLKEAAHLLQLSRRTLSRICDSIDPETGRAYLRCWRPTPGTMM